MDNALHVASGMGVHRSHILGRTMQIWLMVASEFLPAEAKAGPSPNGEVPSQPRLHEKGVSRRRTGVHAQPGFTRPSLPYSVHPRAENQHGVLDICFLLNSLSKLNRRNQDAVGHIFNARTWEAETTGS